MSVTPRLLHRLLTLLLWLPALAVAVSQDDFLPPEEAFRFEARALDERTVEIGFTVADGYYLYGEQFRFEGADAAAVALGPAQIPPGKIKYDETFEKDVESHRGRVLIRLPVTQAPPAFQLVVTSQGCADAGLCYPPMQSTAQASLVAFGGNGSVTVAGSGEDVLAAGPAPASTPVVTPTSGDAGIDGALRSGRFWMVVGVFFAGGLLLSFTPCVLPMLPILSSIIVGDGGGARVTRSRGLLLAVAYSLGMALVYTALGVAAGLAGEGLAAALQNPWVLGAFAALLALLALSMFGAYELQLPAALRHQLNARSQRLSGGRFAGVFAMGGVSALIVSPCVAAPLAGALLYISQTRDVLLGATALFSLAAGMSVPLLLVGASAGAVLPRAGAWMESVKRFFGLLLLGVAWWTLSPVLPGPLVLAGWGLLLIAVATLLGAFDRLADAAGSAARLGKAAGLALAVLGVAQIVGASAGGQDPLQPLQPFALRAKAFGSAVADATGGHGVDFRRVSTVSELDAVLEAADRPVLLDFYADWCVSCKEMERFTFTDEGVRQRMSKALLLQADVTANTEADRALLKRFNLFGPPGIIFFDARGREIQGVRVIGFQNASRFTQSLQAAGL